MHHLTDNHHSIAWFIRQCLENAFQQKEGERTQPALLNQELAKFTLKLPSFLYNAGYTDSIIPPGNIHIKQDGQHVNINIDHVGQFIFDISANRLVSSPNAAMTKSIVYPDEKPEQAVSQIKEHWLKHKQLLKLF